MLNAKNRSFAPAAITVLCMALSAGISTAWAGGSGHSHGHAAGIDIGQPGKASAVKRTIEVLMSDNYYQPDTISVEQGETVRFVIKNQGLLVHEFNIGTASTHAAHQEEMMMMVEHGVLQGDKINHERMKMDMGDGKTMEHNDPNSVLLEPGKAGEIIWTFSTDTKLEFACNVPGHYQAGMVGTLKISHH
jgi:uncharacterized cupredoxin-like copper-binding protein